MGRKIIATAAFLGFTGIILGAFGAHGLQKIVEAKDVATFETGVKYQVYHALFLLFIGNTSFIAEKTKKAILWLTVVGVVFFSVSIYLLALNSKLPFDFKPFGWITPIGGLLLILAWVVLFLNILKRKQ
ncbi:hypothetical protein AM493_16320 [Flavobacterium akiainvivens]|uniref:DUF423 domain-containing protein n=1 Tax=Flavobacterium akiainvivens TaxID=1202724 RepID=A0A0M8MB52_9FLAO|nr:DUF423 domain-containing protein [Flavobacterium akiainvivens]KOS07433.1 hypothetical protein AM493_16320 [Flavobacterium akiainvivens]SFQ48099.1 Uncharacterized membrane protein YgdD, TMEM256/DUF423 family [Flavobacterium akiainvivens]